MNDTVAPIERIQLIAARMLATHPAGRGLCLVGGFRYRLLNESALASGDIHYHWEGDLQKKQKEIVEAFRSKLAGSQTTIGLRRRRTAGSRS